MNGLKPIRRHGRGRRGTALVELALASPLLMLLLAGVLDFSLLLRTAASVDDAARVGAKYGSLSPANSSDYSGMAAAALNSVAINGMTASATRSCKCPGGIAVDCGGSCPTGTMAVYVEVTTRATAHTIFNYSRLPFSGLVSARATMRAQ